MGKYKQLSIEERSVIQAELTLARVGRTCLRCAA